jgi:dolichol-phosphate mannosyltransferase
VPGDVLVVVPTYNEAENLADMVDALRGLGVDVLVVDDDSPDGTGDLAEELAAGDASVDVLHRPERTGLGPAYAAGFARALDAGYRIICQMDCDFSHDPADLPRLIEAVDRGADVAIGSRYVVGGGVENWPWHRRWLSAGGNLYARTMLRSAVRDMTAGYRVFRADALKRLDPGSCEASGYGFQVETAWRAGLAGLAIEEIPIVFRDRVAGTSKMDTRIAVEAMWLVTRWGLRSRSRGLAWPGA